MKYKEVSRRKFLKKASTGVGLGIMGASGSVSAMSMKPVERENKLPREVWVGSVELRVLSPEKTIESRLNKYKYIPA